MIWTSLEQELAAQRGKAVLWLPVILGIGIWVYFSLRFEPTQGAIWALICGGVICGLLVWRTTFPFGMFASVFLWVIAGFLIAVFRTHSVAAPVLGWSYYGAIEGTVVGLDKSGSDKPRITLADPILDRVSAARTPRFVRVSLHSKLDKTPPEPGTRVLITGHLSPPAGPVEPGGFDFQRKAWFQQLGALGYTRLPVMQAGDVVATGWHARVFQLRMFLSAGLQANMNGTAGGFAAAILTGDRSAIDPAALNNLRRANLAHLLAISGLHMGLLTGLVFAAVRIGISVFPRVALRLPVKKIAAVIALFAGFSYLALSGASVATQRAFIMVAVMFGAVLLDRPAISLRAVAMAAIIILALWPENLMEPGFQMSFSATAALVIGFRWLNDNPAWIERRKKYGRFTMGAFSLLMSSLIAGAATAPFAAYHFNQVAHYGLIANTLTLPIMGMIVMPAAVAAAVFSLIGAQALPLWVMGKGIDWILGVADMVAHWHGSFSRVVDATGAVLPMITLGVLFFVLIQSRLRFAGLASCIGGMILWSFAERPTVLVSDTGRLVGVLEGKERALNRTRGSGFAARSWLENDGDTRRQAEANWIYGEKADEFVLNLQTASLGYLWDSKQNVDRLRAMCDTVDLVLAPKWDGDVPTDCSVMGLRDFRAAGAFAVHVENGALKIETAHQRTGARLWNSADVRKAHQ